MHQKKAEWLAGVDTEYHERQFKEPYRSTVAFCDWLESIGYMERESHYRIMDLCCGEGANIWYMARRWPRCDFVGIDINTSLVNKGNTFLQTAGVKRSLLEVGDIYRLDNKYLSAFDGIVSYQTLSWLPDWQQPMEVMARLDVKWIALSSLFYDGQVECNIEVKTYDSNLSLVKESFYNVYALPIVKEFLREKGYTDFFSTPFEIDIDLPDLGKRVMGSYTAKLENGHRLQISGPLLMPWYFIAAKR